MNAFDEIKSLLQAALEGADGFGADVLFDFGDAGALLVAGKSGAVSVREDRGSSDCQIHMSADVFRRIMRGELEEATAFTNGDMRLVGNIAMATTVSNLIRARAAAQ